MLKNESAWNATKLAPLHPSHLPDSGDIFTSSNRFRMRKLSCSDRKPKQEKVKGQLVKKSMLMTSAC
jgi:hypothetical protein